MATESRASPGSMTLTAWRVGGPAPTSEGHPASPQGPPTLRAVTVTASRAFGPPATTFQTGWRVHTSVCGRLHVRSSARGHRLPFRGLFNTKSSRNTPTHAAPRLLPSQPSVSAAWAQAPTPFRLRGALQPLQLGSAPQRRSQAWPRAEGPASQPEPSASPSPPPAHMARGQCLPGPQSPAVP